MPLPRVGSSNGPGSRAVRMSVLLADDRGDFLAAVARHLEPHFEVLKTVGKGQALVDEATRLKPDVVVLDISMPVLNGIHAARQLKATGSSGSVVVFTEPPDPVCLL